MMSSLKVCEKQNRMIEKHKGSTLIEMVVCFTLLAIFVSTAAIIITNVTNLYYHVRGESYARQVGDIICAKIVSEIEECNYNKYNDAYNPCIFEESSLSVGNNDSIDGNSLMLYDETDTKVRIFASDGILKIFYYPITDETAEEGPQKIASTYWTFDKKVYNGYEIKNLKFAPANNQLNSDCASEFSQGSVVPDDYPSNVMVVYMTLKSEKYGTYNICRYVKMYNFSENYSGIKIKTSETP